MNRVQQPSIQRKPAIGFGVVAAVLAAVAVTVAAQTAAPAPPLVLTNIMQIWDVTGEAAQRPHRIQTDVLIYYFDADWSVVFGESRGRRTFIPIVGLSQRH